MSRAWLARRSVRKTCPKGLLKPDFNAKEECDRGKGNLVLAMVFITATMRAATTSMLLEVFGVRPDSSSVYYQ
jgi:hypothetical protein